MITVMILLVVGAMVAQAIHVNNKMEWASKISHTIEPAVLTQKRKDNNYENKDYEFGKVYRCKLYVSHEQLWRGIAQRQRFELRIKRENTE